MCGVTSLKEGVPVADAKVAADVGARRERSNGGRPPLRIHIITEEDPFYLPEFFREFFASLARERFVVTGIDITPTLNRKTTGALAGRLYRFYGPVDFARLGVRYLAARAMDLVSPATVWSGTIRRITTRHGIPCRDTENVNATDYVEALRRCDPDLLLSVAASQIFKGELLAVPRLAAINVHTGTLPKYRGMMPVFWQMYDGRAAIGLTIHAMTAEIDGGEVLLHREIPLDGERNLDTVIRKMKRHGARALVEVLESYYAGSVRPIALDMSERGYRSFPGRREASTFRRMGYRLL
jgi:methionyl-tRNA formyltransferase